MLHGTRYIKLVAYLYYVRLIWTVLKTTMFSRFLKVAIATSNLMNEVYNGGFSPEISVSTLKKSLR